MTTISKSYLKPYSLVRVQEEDYAYCGEVISRETLERTIMIRRVPGDPSTMVEVSVDKLEPIRKQKWVHYAVVSGRSYFPVDMLRYDFAAPVNFRIEEDDWGRITTILNEEETELIIATVSETKTRKRWTTARWASFGWSIRELKTLPIIGA